MTAGYRFLPSPQHQGLPRGPSWSAGCSKLRGGPLLTPISQVLPPHPRGQPPARSRLLTLDGAEAPALVLAVVLGGGAPQVPILAACAGAAVEPLVVILEGDGAGFPVGVPLDGVDLCKEGSQTLALGPLRPHPLKPREPGVGSGQQKGGGAVALDSGFKAPSAVRWSQEPGRGPAAYPTGLERGPPRPLTTLQTPAG